MVVQYNHLHKRFVNLLIYFRLSLIAARHVGPKSRLSVGYSGRASRLRRSGSLRDRSSPLYSVPCISRAPPNSFSPSMTAGITTSRSTVTASASGPASVLSACSPAVPAQWVFAATAVPTGLYPLPLLLPELQVKGLQRLRHEVH